MGDITMGLGVLLEPFSTMEKGTCTLCNLMVATDSETEAKIAMVKHVGRAHPAAYEATTGHVPTPERLQRQEYLMREGIGSDEL